MRKRTFLINALILTATAFLLRAIDIYFRVFLSDKIGTEGMGLFQLIFTIYALAITFATSNLSLSVTRMVAEEAGKGNSTKPILHKSFKISLLFSISAGILLFCMSDFIGIALLHDERTILSLKTLSFCLPFIAASSCLNGYFIAKRKAVKSAASQIFEQIIQIIIVLFTLNFFVGKGLEYACFAICLGATVAELASFLFSFLLYLFEKKETAKTHHVGMIRRIFGICLPMALSSYLRMGLMTTENLLIPIGLMKSGSSRHVALSQFGIIKAMVFPVMFFPAAFLSSFSSLLIPEISEAYALSEQKRLNYTIERALQITMIFSILVTGIFLFFSSELSKAIYGNYDTAFYLKILSPLIPLMYLDSIVDSILKGMNQQVGLLKINVFDSVTRIIFIFFLIPAFGIYGLIIVLFYSNILNPMLSLLKLIKVSQLRPSYTNLLFKPILCICLSCLLPLLLCKILHVQLNLIFIIGLSTVFYLVLIRISECVSHEDVEWAKGVFATQKEKTKGSKKLKNSY
ncbi:MAG: hypothetical protein BGN88_03345 [Clostridiales bacterium 43-6]|nr:MAG: hypothetical protein BGN88_03345 [Clostridiales bacterium 43-6]